MIKRIVLQYVGMAASLLSMFWAVAFLRKAADTAYLGQMAIFLVLLAWSTPFEVSFGNVLINAAKNQPEAVKMLFRGRFNQRLALKSFLIGCGFAAAFFLYGHGKVPADWAGILGIGLIFTVRLLEYAMRTKLLFRNLGQEAQILTNFFTSAKWVATAIFMMSGFRAFALFAAAHLFFGIVSLGVLSWIFLTHLSNIDLNASGGKMPSLQEDAVSIAGVVSGVFAFQLDKLDAGIFLNARDFGEYVSIYTLAFVGPYLLNPIATFVLQRLTLAEMRPHKNHEALHRRLASVIHVASLSINLAVPLAITAFVNATSRPVSPETQHLIAFFIAASYLNCLSHVYYLSNLAKGDLMFVLKQNLCAITGAGAAAGIIWVFRSDQFGFVLLAAGLGQLLYGAFQTGIATEWRRLLPALPFGIYAGAYGYAYPFRDFYLYFGAAALVLLSLSVVSEMRREKLSWSQISGALSPTI